MRDPSSNSKPKLTTNLPLQGMVMPPRVSPTQLIVIPIPNAKLSAETRAALTGKARELAAELAAAGVRTDSDLRDNYTPGWKYNYWELKASQLTLNPGEGSSRAGVRLQRSKTGLRKPTQRAGPRDAATLPNRNPRIICCHILYSVHGSHLRAVTLMFEFSRWHVKAP